MDTMLASATVRHQGKVDVVIFLLLEFNTDGIGLAMMHVLTSSTFVFNFYSYNTP